MDREREIERMVEIAREYGEKIYKSTGQYSDIYDEMTALHNANYRKADEIEKRTAKNIADWLEYRYKNGGFSEKYLEIAKLIRESYHIDVK